MLTNLGARHAHLAAMARAVLPLWCEVESINEGRMGGWKGINGKEKRRRRGRRVGHLFTSPLVPVAGARATQQPIQEGHRGCAGVIGLAARGTDQTSPDVAFALFLEISRQCPKLCCYRPFVVIIGAAG